MGSGALLSLQRYFYRNFFLCWLPQTLRSASTDLIQFLDHLGHLCMLSPTPRAFMPFWLPGWARQGHGCEIRGQEAALRPVEALSQEWLCFSPTEMAPSPFWLLGSVFRGSTLPVFSIRRVKRELSCCYLGYIPICAALSLRSFSPTLFSTCVRAWCILPLSLPLKGCLPSVMLTRRRHAGKMSQLNGPEGDGFVRCQACGKIKAS